MARRIMIQGTMSSVGKSLLTAGLCRIFKQDGLRVAPFKSQNMALNSFVTAQGLEMGRAQVMQCQAAGIEPDVRMNPILLKPTDEIGSQVIVNGEVIGNMSAKAYFAYKKQLVPVILEAFHALEQQYDIIVIEGAGSPAEINLKNEDIVNMGLAQLINAPVLLAGDIDRGGVFAALYGTVMLLPEEERRRIKGFLINKFRGDKNLLAPGPEMLTQRTQIPVLGVIPHLSVDLEDEDSATDRFARTSQTSAVLELAVIKLPKISNFTDFYPFEQIDGVAVRYITTPAQWGNPDCVFVPGSKNTLEDLRWLRQSGLEACIKKHTASGKPVWGICGGYQMLGQNISDPCGAEGGGALRGMELLPIDTVFKPQKHCAQTSGRFAPLQGVFAPLSNLPFHGYEIHMGSTQRAGNAPPLAILQNGSPDGAQLGTVYGTYVHGIFDDSAVVNALLQALLQAKGYSGNMPTVVDLHRHRESQFDQLAQAMRQHVDIQQVYQIMEEFT